MCTKQCDGGLTLIQGGSSSPSKQNCHTEDSLKQIILKESIHPTCFETVIKYDSTDMKYVTECREAAAASDPAKEGYRIRGLDIKNNKKYFANWVLYVLLLILIILLVAPRKLRNKIKFF